jgi:hypothetical protein
MQTVGGNTWIERLAASKRGAKLMKTPQVLETDAAQIETEFSNNRAAGAEWLTSPRAENPQGPVLNKSKRMLGIRSFSPIGRPISRTGPPKFLLVAPAQPKNRAARG